MEATATAASNTTAAQLFTISTEPGETAQGTYKLEYSRRGKEIPTAEKYRSALIYEDALQLSTANSGISSKFFQLVQNTIYDLAQQRFAQELKENINKTEIRQADYTVDAILAYYSEKRASERMSGERVTEWLLASATLTSAELAEGTKRRAVWLERLPKIAAPSFKGSFSKTEAAAILAKLDESDLENQVGAYVANRLAVIINAESQEDAF